MGIDFDRLAKIWKLTISPNAGEAAAARNQAKAIVEREGKTVADILALLGKAQKAKGPTPGAGGFTFYDTANPDHAAAYAARELSDAPLDRLNDSMYLFLRSGAGFLSDVQVDASVRQYRSPQHNQCHRAS